MLSAVRVKNWSTDSGFEGVAVMDMTQHLMWGAGQKRGVSLHSHVPDGSCWTGVQ